MYDLNPQLILYGLSGSLIVEIARDQGLQVYEEVFSDRRYNEDGTLVNRQVPNAFIQSEEEMLVHVKEF